MSEKIFTVDKFLGLNESADGTTELKLGEASKIENFSITDGYNLKSRPGIVRYELPLPVDLDEIYAYDNLAAFPLFISGEPYLIYLIHGTIESYNCALIYKDGVCVKVIERDIEKVFAYNGNVYFLWTGGTRPDHPDAVVTPRYEISQSRLVRQDDGSFLEYISNTYDPLILSHCTPDGKGEEAEKINILSDNFRVSFIADGTSTDYILPDIAHEVNAVSCEYDGFYEPGERTFTFSSAPEKGLEITFYCRTNDNDLLANRKRFLAMPYHEHYNGATDSRIFFYGDGTNLCFYTGLPADGSDLLYVPAMNEVRVDFSDSPITAMIRHYSQLLVFKPDGVDAITYEPLELADGSVIAGFYLHAMNRNFGNNAPGQVLLINNNPRSFSGGSIHEWRIASGYRDERYAKLISQKVAKTLAAADSARVIAFDDDANKTYYVFLNDKEGTVLVNRYELDVWSIYRSELTKDVKQCFSYDGKTLFVRVGGVYCFDPDSAFDAPLEEGGDSLPIDYVWESGYMSFGADYKRKYSSNIWVSMLPETASQMEITVQTDRRDEYLAKTHGLPLFDFSCMDFSNFSFLTSLAPKIKRIKIKVKKFVYYKLIFRSKKPGTRATILGYDQQVRYSSNVK